LIYLTITRPDIAHAVQIFSQFMSGQSERVNQCLENFRVVPILQHKSFQNSLVNDARGYAFWDAMQFVYVFNESPSHMLGCLLWNEAASIGESPKEREVSVPFSPTMP
jgi:hypothetical protein